MKSQSHHKSPSGGIEITSAAALEHLLQHHPRAVLAIQMGTVANPRSQEILKLAKAGNVKVDTSPGRNQDGLRAMIAPFQYWELSEVMAALADKKRATLLALDHLQDPHNFGAICRTAVGLGIDAILIPKDRSVTVSAGVYHSSVGAVQSLPIVQVTNLGEALRKLKDAAFWILGTAIGDKGKPPWEAPDFEKAVLILGSELEGQSPGLDKLCDWHIEIPISEKLQSYNVSVAGAIMMYEWQRRQLVAPLIK